jgi:hypothetical protein
MAGIEAGGFQAAGDNERAALLTRFTCQVATPGPFQYSIGRANLLRAWFGESRTGY